MGTLHLVNHSPERSDAFVACRTVLRPGDGLLLLEDGVLGATRTALEGLEPPIPAGIELLVLDADVRARGLAERLHERCRRVDHAGFVAACVAHDRVLSWT